MPVSIQALLEAPREPGPVPSVSGVWGGFVVDDVVDARSAVFEVQIGAPPKGIHGRKLLERPSDRKVRSRPLEGTRAHIDARRSECPQVIVSEAPTPLDE